MHAFARVCVATDQPPDSGCLPHLNDHRHGVIEVVAQSQSGVERLFVSVRSDVGAGQRGRSSVGQPGWQFAQISNGC